MNSILFICYTNITISPLMAAILRDLLNRNTNAKKMRIESRGAFTGKTQRPPDRRIVELAKSKNISLPNTLSKAIVLGDFDHFDLFLASNENVYWYLKDLNPNLSAPKLRLMLEFSSQLGLREIPDPLYGETEFEKCFQVLKLICENIFNQFCLK